LTPAIKPGVSGVDVTGVSGVTVFIINMIKNNNEQNYYNHIFYLSNIYCIGFYFVFTPARKNCLSARETGTRD
jgi:hypothetical protein